MNSTTSSSLFICSSSGPSLYSCATRAPRQPGTSPGVVRYNSCCMCGRFRLGKGREALKEYFGAEVDLEWSPRYNIAPTDQVPTVRQNATRPVRELSLMRWGLIPYWAK